MSLIIFTIILDIGRYGTNRTEIIKQDAKGNGNE